MPTKYDIDFWIGNDVRKEFVFKDSNGDPVDLDGYTLKYNAKIVNGDQVLLKTLTIVSPTTLGKAYFDVTREETDAIDPNFDMAYELEQWLDDEKTTLLYGAMTLSSAFTGDEPCT